MACSSPKKRAVSNLLALVDQSEGLKTNAGKEGGEKRREEETSSKGEVPHLERNSIFFIKHQQQARWRDTAPIRLLSLHSGGVCRSCYFSAVK